jgi:hypothetical protein
MIKGVWVQPVPGSSTFAQRSIKVLQLPSALRADQRLRRQGRLHYEAAGARVHHADRAQRE